MMMLRSIAHRPIRAGLTLLGISLATGILVVSLFVRDAMEHLIDVTYFLADRQDATVSFVEKRPTEVVGQVARLPGVLAAEPYREVPVRIRSGSVSAASLLLGEPQAPISAALSTSTSARYHFRRTDWRFRPCWPRS
jgi:putative ABC transport system permease protein